MALSSYINSIPDKDVGDEFDINPQTGVISEATYGVNTVKVFMVQETDAQGNATNTYIDSGEITSEGLISEAISMDSTTYETASVPVMGEKGVLAVGVVVLVQPYEEPDVDEVIDEVDIKPGTPVWERVGWTISFYPELNVWGSFHDYIPHLYTYTSKTFYSFYNWKDYPSIFWGSESGQMAIPDESWGIWEHNRSEAPGFFYGPSVELGFTRENKWTHPFELEVIENKERDISKVYSSFAYETEVYAAAHIGSPNLNQRRYKRLDKDGFTKFFVYNNTQHSGVLNIEYLENVRKVGHLWRINKFRDMSKLINSTLGGYAPGGTETSGFEGHITASTFSAVNSSMESTGLDYVGNQDVHDMFEATWGVSGSYTIFTHPYYIVEEKAWNKQRKFSDTYLGIRLIHDNINKNFVNLYSTSVAMRKYNR